MKLVGRAVAFCPTCVHMGRARGGLCELLRAGPALGQKGGDFFGPALIFSYNKKDITRYLKREHSFYLHSCLDIEWKACRSAVCALCGVHARCTRRL